MGLKTRYQQYKIKKELKKEMERAQAEINELVATGNMSVDVLKSEKSPIDILKEYKESIVSEEPKTEEKVEEYDPNKKVTPGFVFSSQYVFDENGNPKEVNSADNVSPDNIIPNEDIISIILSNETVRELVPGITASNIAVYNGMLILTIPRSETSSESFRLDLTNGKIMIQAKLSHKYIDIRTGNRYSYASVDISSEIGRNILTNENYVIRLADIDIENSIMRISQDAA